MQAYQWIHNQSSSQLRLIGILIGGVLIVSMVLYGVVVGIEHSILKTAQDTRTLQIENQDLQIHLDRVRSYQNVVNASNTVQGLKIADDVMDIAQTPQQRLIFSLIPPAEKTPRGVYGY